MSEIDEQLICPVSENDCQWLGEIGRLRQKIKDLSGLVLTDALTGLYNFRHFKCVLQTEMNRSKRTGMPTSLVMIDLDGFKITNDRHGHEVGNLVLKQVADTLISEIRTTDIACRYGGDEFAIIFPDTHLNLAVKVADRIRETIALTEMNTAVGVTASMGASVYMQSSILSVDEFVSSADNYLYEAKKSGPNRICHIDYDDLRAITGVGAEERAMLLLNKS